MYKIIYIDYYNFINLDKPNPKYLLTIYPILFSNNKYIYKNILILIKLFYLFR